MGKKFNLEVVTPDSNFFEGESEMVIIKTTEGDVGILYDHEPLVAPIKIGSLRIKIDGEFKWATCSGGFLTQTEEKLTIITDAAEWIDQIDIDRAVAAKERAEERIKEGAAKGVDVLRARMALERATNRIRLYNRN